ncbi:MAG: M56 family metallopeptidase, partial [Vicinamibacterales bacterium]
MLLVDLAVRATLIFFAALVTTCALRRAAAATRHLTWTLAVVSVLALPLLVLALPEWPILPGGGPGPARPHVASPDADAAVPSLNTATSGAGPVSTATAPSARILVNAALAIWGLVTCALVARIAAGIGAVRRLARHARPADARSRDLLDRVAAAAGVSTPIRLLVSDDVSTPMTWGGRRPLLLLPRDARGWSDARVWMVLLHEIAHIRRADWLTHAISRVVVAFHWFNPLAWIAMRAMTRERERACDDFVVAQGAPATDYAQHLLDIARSERPGPARAVAPAMARRSELEGRVLSILTPHRREACRSAAPLLTLAAIAAAGLVAAAAPAHVPPPD